MILDSETEKNDDFCWNSQQKELPWMDLQKREVNEQDDAQNKPANQKPVAPSGVPNGVHHQQRDERDRNGPDKEEPLGLSHQPEDDEAEQRERSDSGDGNAHHNGGAEGEFPLGRNMRLRLPFIVPGE